MKNKYAILVISSVLLSISGFAATQEPVEIFVEMENSSASAVPTSMLEESRGILSKNKVNVNVQALLNGSSVQVVANLKKMVVDPDAGEGFLMQLPGGTVVTLITNRVHSYLKGVETYSGRVKDIESGHFTLSIENGKVFGQVNIEFMAYDISYDKGSKSHILSEIDLAKVPKHSPEPLSDVTTYKAALEALSFPTPLLSGSAIGTVRVLILYGSDVSNASTLASNIISEMNDTFFDDGMDPDLHVTLADLRNLNNDLDGVCKEDILEGMEDADSPFTNIATWVDDEDADVVLTIATTDPDVTNCSENGSYGRIGGQASALLDSTKPYAVTMDTYAIGDLTAVHELGHVLGGGHPTWSVSTLESFSDDVEPYSRGYIAGDGDWQTIMGAYDDNDCDFSTTLPNTDCVRLPLWSDPTKSYDSETRGVTYTSDTQVPYSADMAAALEIQMPIAAVFESYPYSAPGTPSLDNVEKCFQHNIVEWNSVTNAENYQVLYSFWSSFTNPEVIYFGSNTYLNVRVFPNSTKYVKFRACNGSGCGAYGSQLTLTYNSFCN